MTRPTDIPPPLRRIVSCAARCAGLHVDDLLAPQGDARTCDAKRVAWYVASRQGYSQSEIARQAGFHPSTIHWHLARAHDLLDIGDAATQRLYQAVTESLEVRP